MQNQNQLLAAVKIGEELKLHPNVGIVNDVNFSSVGAFISSVLPNIYVLAGIILFVIIVIAGLMFIFNAGKGDEKAAETSKKALTAGIIGLVLIFASFWLIQIIEIVAGFKILNP